MTGRISPRGQFLVESILTLVAPPDCKLETSVSEIAVTALGVGGAHSVDGVEFFSNNRAADIRWEGDPWDEHIADAVRLAISHKPVDYALQPAKHRGKRLMIADMDSTIVASETLDEMAARAGVGHRVSEITSRAMNGEIDFQTALRERVRLLAGVEAGILEDVYSNISITPGADVLVRSMANSGAECLLVSGGFKFFTDRVAHQLGFHGNQANDIEINSGRITGELIEPILDSAAKVQALEAAMQRLAVGPESVLAVGDGSNDIPMLRRAGLGVAWRGKPVVKAQTRARIDYGDLSTLLIFQRMDPA
jgi:phosphoserine phosphatase